MAMSKVLVNFVQDRSGSMASCWDETLSGFKKFVEDLREKGPKDGVEYLLSMTTFDTLVESPIMAKPIAEVDTGELAKHGPRGCTALYDAVGATIENTSANDRGAEKIICVVVTDGYENSSREWTKDRLHKTVDAKLNLGNWTFVYLGTQPETWAEAGAIGVGAGSISTYQPEMARAAYAFTSEALHSLASSPMAGSRNLFQDHAKANDAAAAGMKVTPVVPCPDPKAASVPKAPHLSWRKTVGSASNG
jgi:hypothetical protein